MPTSHCVAFYSDDACIGQQFEFVGQAEQCTVRARIALCDATPIGLT